MTRILSCAFAATLLSATLGGTAFAQFSDNFEQKNATITSGPMTAHFTDEDGLVRLELDGKTVLDGDTTRVGGAYFTLASNSSPQLYNLNPTRDDGKHFAVDVGRVANELNHGTPRVIESVFSRNNTYITTHRYAGGLTVSFSHALNAPDLTCTVTLTNNSPHYFQLHDWRGPRVLFDRVPTIWRQMTDFYPNGTQYSPVVCAWDDDFGLGINWINHRLRPIEIRFLRTSSDEQTPDRSTRYWTRNAPVPPGGQARYTVVYRLDSTPEDWRHLLKPYKQYFNRTFGSQARYNTDFRIMAMTMPSNAELISETNPNGTRFDIDTDGWGAYIQQRLARLQGYDISRIIVWAVTASARGENYRPEFDLLPEVVEQTLPILRDFCRASDFGYGVFARPNDIAYHSDRDKDYSVPFNPLDAAHLRMLDRRYRFWLDHGATGFYMDTYGSKAVGEWPMGGESSVLYLKRLREMAGPDNMIFIEHGFDAQHLEAAIWPPYANKRPFGDWARYLADGTVEICRVATPEAAAEVWAQGGIPIGPEYAINENWMAVQRQYVQDDWTNVTRPDAPAALTAPTPGPESAPGEHPAR